ncbi:MAG: glycosyltransferase family 4 protein [bacterium]
MAGAEQNIMVTAPYLREGFRLSGLFSKRSGRDEDAFGKMFESVQFVDFDGAAEVVRAEVTEAVLREQPALIYVHKCISVPVLEALVATRIPLVRMEHDHDIYCMRRYKYFPWNRRICTKKAGLCCLFPCMAFLARDRDRGRFGIKWVSYREQQKCIQVNKAFSAYFVVTEYMREELIRQGFEPGRIHIFPPIPLPRQAAFTPSFSARNRVIFAGQIIRGKGLDVLLHALKQCRESFELVVLGSGSHQSYCEALSRELGLVDRVHFPGFVSQEELAGFYADATLVVVPSVWPEPIATIGLEVLRYGLPVVGFDAGGIRDWLRDGETGYLIPWMDVRLMAERIDYLLSHKDVARRLGEQGREFVNRVYDFEAYIARMIQTFRVLADQGSERAR